MIEQTDIFDKLSILSQNNNPRINTAELLIASKLAFWGISKYELRGILSEEIYNDDMSVKSGIVRLQFTILDELKIDLANYADYLNGSGKKLHECSGGFLLPSYRSHKKVNDLKKLYRHWKIFQIKYNDLSAEGRFYYRRLLRENGYDHIEDEKVAEQFRIKNDTAETLAKVPGELNKQQAYEHNIFCKMYSALEHIEQLDLSTLLGVEIALETLSNIKKYPAHRVSKLRCKSIREDCIELKDKIDAIVDAAYTSPRKMKKLTAKKANHATDYFTQIMDILD